MKEGYATFGQEFLSACLYILELLIMLPYWDRADTLVKCSGPVGSMYTLSAGAGPDAGFGVNYFGPAWNMSGA